MNLSNEPQTLHKGTSVAECYPVVHVSDVNSDMQSSSGTTYELLLHSLSRTEEFKKHLGADEYYCYERMYMIMFPHNELFD